jgi:hypothetical protein
MRLTLRTLLAWLDDTLPASQVRDIGKQVSESPFAQELVERIHRVTRQRRLTVPSRSGPEATDPNLVACYVDNDMDAEQVAEYEKKCLASDVNLAEVASVHQILSLLGQKVHVPAEAKARMNQLVKGRESIPVARSDGLKPPEVEPVTKPIQPWVTPEPPRKHWVERFGPLAGCLLLIGILSWSAYHSLSPATEEAGEAAAVADANLRTIKKPGPVAAGSGTLPDANAGMVAGDMPKGTEPKGTEPANTSRVNVKPAVEKEATPVEASKAEESVAKKATEAAKVKDLAAAAPAVPDGAVGVVSKADGVLLRYDSEKREWERIQRGTGLKTGDRLLCLAPFRSVILLGKTPLTLIGETQVRVTSKAVTDPTGFELLIGGVLLAEAAPQGTLKIEYGGQTATIDHASSGRLGLERVAQWHYGHPPLKPVPLLVHVVDGENTVSLGSSKETLREPGTLVADTTGSLKALDTKQQLPKWMTGEETSAKEQKLGEQFLALLSAGRPVKADIVAATEDESPVTRKMAIFAIKALGDLSYLTPILTRAGDPSARESTVSALRSYLSYSPEAERTVRLQLQEDFSEATGVILEKLLVGFTPEETKRSDTLRKLLELLPPQNENLAVRELAVENLEILTEAKVPEYDPEKPDEQGVNAWKKLLENKSKPTARKPAS